MQGIFVAYLLYKTLNVSWAWCLFCRYSTRNNIQYKATHDVIDVTKSTDSHSIYRHIYHCITLWKTIVTNVGR